MFQNSPLGIHGVHLVIGLYLYTAVVPKQDLTCQNRYRSSVCPVSTPSPSQREGSYGDAPSLSVRPSLFSQPMRCVAPVPVSSAHAYRKQRDTNGSPSGLILTRNRIDRRPLLHSASWQWELIKIRWPGLHSVGLG